MYAREQPRDPTVQPTNVGYTRNTHRVQSESGTRVRSDRIAEHDDAH